MPLSNDDRQFLLFSAQCPLDTVARRAEQTLLAELDEIRNHQLLELLHRRNALLGEIEDLERKKSGLEPPDDVAAQLELELADVAPSPVAPGAAPRRSTRRPYRP